MFHRRSRFSPSGCGPPPRPVRPPLNLRAGIYPPAPTPDGRRALPTAVGPVVPGRTPPARPPAAGAGPGPAPALRRSPGRGGGGGARLHGDQDASGASRGCPGECLHGGAGAAPSPDRQPEEKGDAEDGERDGAGGRGTHLAGAAPVLPAQAVPVAAGGGVLPGPYPGRQRAGSPFRRHLGSPPWG